MGIADVLREAGEQTVEVGGIHWRIRVPSTRDLLAAGGTGAVAAVPDGDATPADITTGVEMLAQVDAMVCSAVIGAGQAPDAIEPVTLVRSLAEEERAAARVWIERLPTASRGEIAIAVGALLKDGGRLARAAETFRGRA